MMSSFNKSLSLLFSFLIAAILACSIPAVGNDETELPSLESTEEIPLQADAATDVPSEPTATIVHTTFPGEPTGLNSFMLDASSKALASERRATADNFDILFLERPFTSEVMDYQDYLDITRAELSLRPPWVYVTIFLEGAPPDGSEALYAVELDLDIDGRGDWFIRGRTPPSSDWTTDGVMALTDANGDVGGPNPMRADGPLTNLDGYEDLVFDQGHGPDADAAWIRRDPSNPNRVQLAFKHNLIGSDGQFLWGVWSDEGVREPAWSDYHDHFTLQQAGSPLSGNSNYPLKELASMDNTCRWAVGYEPNGTEPGVCFVPPTPTPVPPTATPTATPEPGGIFGQIFLDFNGNGVVNGGEGGISGYPVTLGAGACASSGLDSKNSAGDGTFSFNNLPPGQYCVSTNLPSGCGQYTNTTPKSRTVMVNPGATLLVIFGYQPIIC